MASFRKVLGFWDLFWLSVGGMVGVAILTFASVTYGYAGPSSIISWILAGVFSIFMALVYSEMVTAFPDSGALVVFPYEGFGKGRIARYLAFLEGAGYYIGTLFGIVISAIILGSYVSPALATGTAGSLIIAELSLLFVGIINILGAKVTSKINLLMSIFFMVIFSAVIILGIIHGSASRLMPFFSGTSKAVGIVYAIPIAILAYGSWTALITIPEEAKDVKKIPKAMVYSLLVVTLLYALIVLAVYMGLSSTQLNKTFYYYPVFGLVALLGNNLLLLAFQIAAIFAIIAVMLVMVMSNSRILVALSRLKFLPGKMSEISKRSIPLYATLLSFLIPMALSFFPTYYYQYVVIGAIIGTGLPRVIDLASYLKLRGSKSYKPSFKVKYGVAFAAMAFIGLVISELSLGISDIEWSVVAFGMLTFFFIILERTYAARKNSVTK